MKHNIAKIKQHIIWGFITRYKLILHMHLHPGKPPQHNYSQLQADKPPGSPPYAKHSTNSTPKKNKFNASFSCNPTHYDLLTHSQLPSMFSLKNCLLTVNKVALAQLLWPNSASHNGQAHIQASYKPPEKLSRAFNKKNVAQKTLRFPHPSENSLAQPTTATKNLFKLIQSYMQQQFFQQYNQITPCRVKHQHIYHQQFNHANPWRANQAQPPLTSSPNKQIYWHSVDKIPCRLHTMHHHANRLQDTPGTTLGNIVLGCNLSYFGIINWKQANGLII